MSFGPSLDVAIREDWIYGAEGEDKVAGFMLPVNGTLGIQADAAPALYLNCDFVASFVKAYVKSAPVGADLTFTIYVGTSAWMSLTIAGDHFYRGHFAADRRRYDDSC